ncbi:ABC transporter ATP-binding protein [Rugosimonospora africana]|uniref:ABC transporter ATP-binding protein n=1 Tax=Rugosimonospora africana TaxID=556532 RepID=A0A8J3QYW1_9ACTN|nr:ABC transporter ATP-binding protein [Rugosimonospora africana]GIH19804.1 ABC transporter ATP-binding protein [Rugosimonospora africana]
MAAAMMSVRGLSRDFRGFRAVDRVDLDIARDSVHALVGPNGAGKTTLFNLLTGFLTPTAGRVELDGRDITGLPPERIAGLGVARSFQITSLFPQLSAVEQVELALQGHSGRGMAFWRSRRTMRRYREPAMRVLEQVGLEDVAAVPGQELAYGRKRALELALALALHPRVLLLDEPTAGMGLEDIDRTVELIERVRRDRTVVMVEHNMSVVGRLADRVTVLTAGRVLVEGGYDEVRADPRVIDAYLGTGHAAR